MKLETFFEKFELFADAPDAVAKMRELVMQLAVEGGLVPHLSAEPAIPYSSAEDAKPINVSVVPQNWRVILLADAIKNRSGNSKLIKGKLHDEPAEGRYQGFSASGPDVWCNNYEYEGQAIIVSAVGARCGKAFKASGKWSAIANTNITRPEPTLLDFDFAYLVLNNEHFWVRGGSAQPFVKFPSSLNRYFALPPLAEQKRIVAKVDELMALCDRLEAQQQERKTWHAALARASLVRFAKAPTPANLHFLFHPSYAISPADLRKSILTLAVQGKLVPQDPNDEPAARVLQRIDAAPKRAMRTRNTGEEGGKESIELAPLFELPPGWEWAPFRRLPLQASVGIDRGRSMQGPDKAVGYFKMNNIRNSGGVDLSDLTRIDATPDEIEAFALADGDFLFNTRNSRELVGKTCVFRTRSEEPILYNNNILRVRFIEGFSPDFLDYWFRSPEGSAELEKLKSNTTNVCAIYQGKLSGFPCVIPPLAEQHRIVAKVEQLMALVDALETQLAASHASAARILDALVADITQPT
jgi:restriction endonuclease S subunit